MTHFTPTGEDEVADILTRCSAEGEPVEIIGRGTKRGWGSKVAAAHRLELSQMGGVTLYQPNELVLSAKAGTPLAEIEKLLHCEGQMLAFEPMDAGPLFGDAPHRGTIGGTLGCNLSGPRRIASGAARDHALGIRAVAGGGRLFKSGGRVVKNVTGYDLSRGLAGSWGTLAVMTEVTFKVLPKPESGTTVVLHGLNDRAAVDLMCAAMGSPWEISGAAHLTAGLAPHLAGAEAATLLRLEGFAPSVAYRLKQVAEMLPKGAEFEAVSGETSSEVWAFVRDARCFAVSQRYAPSGSRDQGGSETICGDFPPPVRGRATRSTGRGSFPDIQHLDLYPDGLRRPTSLFQGQEEEPTLIGHKREGQRPLWRVSVRPAAGPDLMSALRELDLRYFYDWSGGLVWIEHAPDAAHEDILAVRTAAEKLGGHATLVRHGEASGRIPAFQPQPKGLAALAGRLKKSFDPAGILNPARMS